MRLNPMSYQGALQQVLNEKRGTLVIAGELSRHQYLTKEKTDEMALKEQADAKLQSKPASGYLFSVKNAKVISGAGIGTVMEQIITSGFKPGNDGNTYTECRCGKRMPKLYVQENGAFVDITQEFVGKSLSYTGPVQVCYSLSKGMKDGRIYINVDGVLFATKPDIYVPEGNNRDVSTAFAATGFYGQAAAPAQPAGFAQAAAPAQPAGFAQAAAPAAAPVAPAQAAAPVAPAASATDPAAATPAAPAFTWPQ